MKPRLPPFRRNPISSAELSRPKLAAGAAACAAAELLLTLGVGRFFDWGRAEALLFFAFRPWLLLVAALLVARFGWRSRLIFYALALSLAALGESLFLFALGAANPWPEMLRGLVAGAALLVIADLLFQAGRRWLGPYGPAPLAIALVVLNLTVGLGFYEAIALGAAEERERTPAPELMLMTGLPIIWGEGGFDINARPAPILEALEREFRLRPLDTLKEAELARGTLLLLAQPPALAPAELAALDQWVRRGGQALILTDPVLAWPSELPPGDIRRPPAIGLLGPLLRHWGLELEPPLPERRGVEGIRIGRRKLRLASPGRFRLADRGCGLRLEGLIADCTLGQGRALLVADADLMHERLWTGPAGTERHQRIADNPLILAHWLDELAGLERTRSGGEVQWLSERTDRGLAIMLGLLPTLLTLAAASLVRRP